VSFWPALLFNDADMRALRPRSNHHGLGQERWLGLSEQQRAVR
jgi:hypothetical protein